MEKIEYKEIWKLIYELYVLCRSLSLSHMFNKLN